MSPPQAYLKVWSRFSFVFYTIKESHRSLHRPDGRGTARGTSRTGRKLHIPTSRRRLRHSRCCDTRGELPSFFWLSHASIRAGVCEVERAILCPFPFLLRRPNTGAANRAQALIPVVMLGAGWRDYRIFEVRSCEAYSACLCNLHSCITLLHVWHRVLQFVSETLKKQTTTSVGSEKGA